jgi:hypothetical protein
MASNLSNIVLFELKCSWFGVAKNLGNAKISKKAEFVWDRLIQFLKDLEMNGSEIWLSAVPLTFQAPRKPVALHLYQV